MKILIAYYTKTGTTARCAAMLREKFHNHDMTVADLAAQSVVLDDYDVVILGAPVRMGRMDKRLRRFLKENAARLRQTKAAYFVCCGLPQEARDVMEKDIPAELLACAVAAGSFGGELKVEAQRSFWGKLLVRLMRQSIQSKQFDEDLSEEEKPRFPEILPDHISRFADEIKQIR